jgi:hypothetical protein
MPEMVGRQINFAMTFLEQAEQPNENGCCHVVNIPRNVDVPREQAVGEVRIREEAELSVQKRQCNWCTHREVKPLLSDCLDFPIHFIGIRDVNHQPILCSLDKWNCPKRRFIKGPVDPTPHGFLFFPSNDTENVPALGFITSRLRADIAVVQV